MAATQNDHPRTAAAERTESETAAMPPPASLAQTIVVWVVLMTALFLTGLTGMVWVVSESLLTGLAIGSLAAMFAGPGFGVMTGSAVHAMRLEKARS